MSAMTVAILKFLERLIAPFLLGTMFVRQNILTLEDLNFSVSNNDEILNLTLLMPELKWIRPVRGGTSTWEVITPWILPRFSWNFHV